MSPIPHPLEFERALVELEIQLEAMRDAIVAGDESRRGDYAKLEARVAKARQETYGKLTPYQRVQLSRHFDRPFTLDFIKHMLEDFVELHGDRAFRDDPAIVGGTARLNSQPIMVIGHQRGRTTQERVERNFGMPQPEGYRKALRLFKMAEKFKLPLLMFIDTTGAYPGLEAEERGQSEAIAHNLIVLAQLKVPIISVVIGEGGSGGALALGVADRILMLENSCYSVISPEGCASILWGQEGGEPAQNLAAQAADMLQITAPDLLRHKIVDQIIAEPVGGAHANHKEAAEILRPIVSKHFEQIKNLSEREMLDERYKKFRKIGVFA